MRLMKEPHMKKKLKMILTKKLLKSLQTIKRKRKKLLEKYTFSVGPLDVSRVLVYVGQLPSFVVIETTKKFADVACNRIGQKVLSPGSRDPTRRYLFAMLHSSYNQNAESFEEIISF